METFNFVIIYMFDIKKYQDYLQFCYQGEKIIILGMIIRSVIQKVGVQKISLRLKYLYRIDDILKKKTFEFVPFFYAPAFHLYVDRFDKMPFDEKFFLAFIKEHSKLDKPIEQFNKITELASKNLDKFESYKSISFFLAYAHDIKYQNRSVIQAFVNRAFELLSNKKQQERFRIENYSLCRLFLLTSRMIGLRHFKEEQFESVVFSKIKPLFLVYILQLFWQQNIQYNYKFPRKILQYLLQNEKFIPFSDSHHILMAKKVIKDPDYLGLSQRLQERMKNTVNQNKQQQYETKVSEQAAMLLYQDYVRDLQKKYL